ncbi:9235_t:CDS:2 [Ambispora gerdemannii]|uniref:9235_t:CDS:1 n=1 Tax=Ambispora gerdemannii TaxID=144530 RepID=A0A9N8V8P9_9GLOM|nr:9235_t:CDS:2 [Ambispora gerdemannii]
MSSNPGPSKPLATLNTSTPHQTRKKSSFTEAGDEDSPTDPTSPSNHYSDNSHFMNPPPNNYPQVTFPTSSNSIASSRSRPNPMNHHHSTSALHTMYWCKPRVYGDPPPACRAHSSALVDKKLFIFGGGDGPIYFNDLYIFDTDSLTWSRPLTTGDVPSPRRAHTTAHYNNRIYVFGGGDGVRALNDVYVLNISDLNNLVWEKIEPLGTPPISRGYHTSNLVGNKLVVYGGSDGHECFKDIHVLDLEINTWFNIAMESSYPRLSHTATQVGSYLFVVCGHDGTKYTSDVLLLNLVTMQWETRKVYGSPPSGRGYHTAVLYDSRLFVFGGYDGHSVFDEVFVLDLSACAYLPQITNFQLPGL